MSSAEVLATMATNQNEIRECLEHVAQRLVAIDARLGALEKATTGGKAKAKAKTAATKRTGGDTRASAGGGAFPTTTPLWMKKMVVEDAAFREKYLPTEKFEALCADEETKISTKKGKTAEETPAARQKAAIQWMWQKEYTEAVKTELKKLYKAAKDEHNKERLPAELELDTGAK